MKGTSARVVHLRTTNLLLEMFQFAAGNTTAQNANRPVIGHRLTHLCLAVTDLDAEYARLAAAGMRVHRPPTQIAPGLRTTYGRDPFGYVIEREESQCRARRVSRSTSIDWTQHGSSPACAASGAPWGDRPQTQY